MKIHHIGYAVKDISKSLKMFVDLGYELKNEIVEDKKRKVEIVFVQNNNYLVELISPLDGVSPINNYLDKIGSSPYHICYETNEIELIIANLRKQRYLIVEQPSEAIALNNRRVAFLYHPNYGLLELLETI
jgi:methylmalonyl-CoA/ethylmalonyl-CoA epimerase